ncbi:MAG: acyl-CoA dehydratase activase [Candidatus Wallbacteria bacterium]
MITAGLDIGSRTIKLAIIKDGEVRFVKKEETSFEPLGVCAGLLEGISFDRMIATGYGRHLVSEKYGCETITEIKAHALGARFLSPGCRTVLDIGGQDTKVILLDAFGRVRKFEMNDKCAAGTGRFLEIMALALGYPPSEFGKFASTAGDSAAISNMCTVFAESEVISLISKGVSKSEVARGVHETVARRASAMLQKNGYEDKVMFSGGVALNNYMVSLIKKHIKTDLIVAEDPQAVGAIGAAWAGCTDRV